MKNLLYKTVIYFCFCIFFFCLVGVANASVLLDEDFDDHEGSIPPGWSLVDEDGSGAASNFIVNQGKLGMSVLAPRIGEIVYGDPNWTDYIYEFDLVSYTGDDRNVIFRWQDENHRLGIHITGGILYVEKLIPASEKGGPENPIPMPSVNVSGKIPHNMVHHFTITLKGKLIEVSLKNDLIDETLISFEDSNANAILNGAVGLRVGSGNGTATVFFDNVKVTSIEPDALPVPYFAQNDEAWGSDIYDYAPEWNLTAVPDDIATWGCALTNAAMVLNYHGFTKLHDGETPLDPGTLNSWLNSQADGHWRIGATSWGAISRLTRELYDAGQNDKKLEFRKIKDADMTDSDDFLGDGNPDIYKIVVPESPSGVHFVTATGIIDPGIEYSVHDPLPINEQTSLLAEETELLDIDRFIPTNSNFSYVVVHTPPDLHALLEHQSGEKIGSNGSNIYEEHSESWFDYQPPINGYGDTVEVSGEGHNELAVPTPLNGEYELQLKADEDGWYSFEIYFYDLDGNVVVEEIRIYLESGENRSFFFEYTQDSNVSKFFGLSNFDTFIQEVERANKLGSFSRSIGYYRLLNTAKVGARFEGNKDYFVEVALKNIKKAFEYRNAFLDQDGFDHLYQEYLWLLASLGYDG